MVDKKSPCLSEDTISTALIKDYFCNLFVNCLFLFCAKFEVEKAGANGA